MVTLSDRQKEGVRASLRELNKVNLSTTVSENSLVLSHSSREQVGQVGAEPGRGLPQACRGGAAGTVSKRASGGKTEKRYVVYTQHANLPERNGFPQKILGPASTTASTRFLR